MPVIVVEMDCQRLFENISKELGIPMYSHGTGALTATLANATSASAIVSRRVKFMSALLAASASAPFLGQYFVLCTDRVSKDGERRAECIFCAVVLKDTMLVAERQ